MYIITAGNDRNESGVSHTLSDTPLVLFRLFPACLPKGAEADFHLFLITLYAFFEESGEAGHIFIVSVGA